MDDRVVRTREPYPAQLVVENERNGHLVDRVDDPEQMVELLADRMLETWAAIRSGAMAADDIREHVIPYSVDVQLHQHFARHSTLAAGQAA